MVRLKAFELSTDAARTHTRSYLHTIYISVYLTQRGNVPYSA